MGIFSHIDIDSGEEWRDVVGIPNPESLFEVNHIDGDCTNNEVTNLEWCTSADNHKYRLATSSRRSYRIKVTCLETSEEFESITAAGNSVNADATQIIESINSQSCCKGKTFVYSDSMPEDIASYLDAAHSKYEAFHRRPSMPNSRKVKDLRTGRVFDSIATAAKVLGISKSTVALRASTGQNLQFVS